VQAMLDDQPLPLAGKPGLACAGASD
jgi:hypothetical protein